MVRPDNVCQIPAQSRPNKDFFNSSFQVLNEEQSSGDGVHGVPDILGYDANGRSSKDKMSQVSLSAPSKKSSKNKLKNSATEGLKDLSDSLKDMSKSSKRVARIHADSAELQNLCTIIEAL